MIIPLWLFVLLILVAFGISCIFSGNWLNRLIFTLGYSVILYMFEWIGIIIVGVILTIIISLLLFLKSKCNVCDKEFSFINWGRVYLSEGYDFCSDSCWNTFLKSKEKEIVEKEILILGKSKQEAKNYFEAIRKYEDVLKLNSGNFLAMCGLGDCYLNLNDFEKSIEFYNRALEISPKHAPSLEGKARVYLALKDYETLKESVKPLLKLDPKNSFALHFHNAFKQLEKDEKKK